MTSGNWVKSSKCWFSKPQFSSCKDSHCEWDSNKIFPMASVLSFQDLNCFSLIFPPGKKCIRPYQSVPRLDSIDTHRYTFHTISFKKKKRSKAGNWVCIYSVFKASFLVSNFKKPPRKVNGKEGLHTAQFRGYKQVFFLKKRSRSWRFFLSFPTPSKFSLNGP